MAADLSGVDQQLAYFGYELLKAAATAGLGPQVTSTVRSHGHQRDLYRRYLAGLSSLPAAPPGRSAHEYGWAFDMVVTPYSSLADVGALWQSWGGTWGGVADPVHFELPGASEWLRSLSDDQISALIAA